MHIRNMAIAFCVLLLNISCSQKTNTISEKEISDGWEFKQSNKSDWLPATVPGTVHTDLLDNNKIEDPFYRLNEHDLQWIDKVDWEYKTTFIINNEESKKSNHQLVFNGLDTYAKVFLNDELILESDNMFRTYKVDCSKTLKQGENKLLVKFESPINKGIEKYDALDYTIPVSNNDLSGIGKVEDGKRVSIFTRKAGYHFGWDWGPRLVTSGIWRPIVLQSWDGYRINDLFIKQESLSKKAELTANIEIESNLEASEVEIQVLVNEQITQTKKVSLANGLNNVEIPFAISNPELWWPNGMGKQKLYNIEVNVNNSTYTTSKKERIGLRTIELVTEPDSIGTSFYFAVNGHPVFMKGANYIPQDVFLPRVEEKHYTHILQSAVDANMNMLRIWGGGVYESDLFYEMCDELGLLVWQDFMFACAMFPGDSAFLKNVELEAIDNVKRLRNHASIALWCGNNEILSAWHNWGWKDAETKSQGKEVADVIWKAYDDIFHKILPQVVEEYQSDVRYWPSSPGAAFGEKEETDRGDMHYWGVWWGKEPFANFETVMPRFMSEFGFQSFPEFESVKKYALPEDNDIFSDVMKSHQRSTIGNGTIQEYMMREYEQPKDFESFLYISHLLQADGVGFGIEAQRRNRNRCMGSLYWQINDCWPVASWSGIDYYGKWKALHFKIREVFEPVIVSYKDNAETLDIYVVSDLLEELNGELKLALMDFEGNTLETWTETITVTANQSKKYYTLDKKSLWEKYKKEEVLLVGALYQDDKKINQNLFYFEAVKNLMLPQPDLDFVLSETEANFNVIINTKKLARGVYLSTPLLGNFSDNYFDLLPGKEILISFPKKDGVTLESFKSGLKVQTMVDAF